MTRLVPLSHPNLRTAVATIRGEVKFEEPLKEWTSLRIGGPAEALVIPEDIQDLSNLLINIEACHIPWCVLGGTNLLIQDQGVRGVVISLSKINGIQDETEERIFAEAGVRMPLLLQHAIKRSLSGLEWAAGIPGTVGGGVVMNAGTHLGEMKDALQAVQMVNPLGQIVTLRKEALSFRYRHIDLPKGIVVGAWFQLKKAPQQEIESATKNYLQYRKNTQPLTRPNAGSIFKNPPGQSAGKLIEEAGLKGTKIGDAQISQKHANFIVNIGDARATDVILLIKKIQQEVFKRNGIQLELELKVMGDS
jgi:UDP-N-acetylmuramate dehydrogenase